MKHKILITVLFLCLCPPSLFSASDDAIKKNDSGAATSPKELPPAEAKPTAIEIVSEQMSQQDSAADQAVEAKQVAGELRQAQAEHETLTKEIANISTDSQAATPGDPEILLKAKLAEVELRKKFLEKKVAFLQEKKDFLSVIHQKMQFYLRAVFSEDASFLVVIRELKEMRKSRAARLMDKLLLRHEIEPISNRIIVEEKYLSTKNAILPVTTENEKPYMLKTIVLAENRLQILKDTKALLEEKMEFLTARISANEEFDKLIRLRRDEVFLHGIYSKTPVSYSAIEIAGAVLAVLFLAGLFLMRKRFYTFSSQLPFFLNRGLFRFVCKMLWVLGLISLVGYSGLSAFGFRFAALALGILYLNVAGGLMAFLIVTRVMEWLSILVIQKISKASQIEIKKSSAAYSLVNTVFQVLVFLAIASYILAYWAVRQETAEFLLAVLNYPVLKAAKVDISVRVFARSVLVFWIFHWLSRLINGVLKTKVYPKTSLDINSQDAIKSVIQFVMITAGLLVSIQLLGIDLSALAVFSGTLGLGIGFGLQDIIKNVFSGFVIYFERPIRIGDVVEVGATPGTVKAIRTRSTVINTYDNISIVVPNSEFLTQRVVNWSLSDRTVRVESRVGVAYGSDVEVVKQTLLEITKANKNILAQPEPLVIFEDFADSALLFRVLYWVILEDRLEAKSEINFSINAKFKEKGIVIPFPQRDVHLKSSDFDLRIGGHNT